MRHERYYVEEAYFKKSAMGDNDNKGSNIGAQQNQKMYENK